MDHVGRRMTRRTFLDYLLSFSLLGLTGIVLYPLAKYLIPPKVTEVAGGSVIASKVGELAPNTGKIFPFGGKPAILINTPDGEIRAFTAVCTHLACTVQYRPELAHIWCACHDGHYDLRGQVISGPPPRPLEEYQVTVKGDNIVVSRKG